MRSFGSAIRLSRRGIGLMENLGLEDVQGWEVALGAQVNFEKGPDE